MNVQIFIQEDNKELIYDNEQLQEFKSLVDELGLKCNNHINPEKSPIPYMWLDEATIRAFKLLCPTNYDVKNYQFEIPIEVLRNIKLCQTESYFDWIEVWCNEKDPDPFLIGRVYKNHLDRQQKYTWAAHNYLIARWGSESKEVPQLIEMALKIAASRILDYSESTIAKLKSWKECPESWARQYIFSNNTEASHAINNNSGLLF